MREIKFRGQQKDTKIWVYGSVIQCAGLWYIYNENENFRMPQDPDFENSFIEIIPETMGQFTGLYDKNGKEVFEGDIIKWVDSDGNERIDEVKFVNGGFILCNTNYTIFHYPNKEIIGNIHDNPELLEQEQWK